MWLLPFRKRREPKPPKPRKERRPRSKLAVLVTWRGAEGCEVERRRVYGPDFLPEYRDADEERFRPARGRGLRYLFWVRGNEPLFASDLTPAQYHAYVSGNDASTMFEDEEEPITLWSNIAFIVAVVLLYPICGVLALMIGVQLATTLQG